MPPGIGARAETAASLVDKVVIMLRKIYSAIYKRIAPIAYARSLGVRLGTGCRLIDVDFSTEPYLISMGDHVSATAVRFETHDGGVWVLRHRDPDIDIVRPIRIGSNVFIGYGTIVLPGVSIGNDVVIGAGSVVTKDIPSGVVAAGVPARIIRSTDDYASRVRTHSDPTKGLSYADKRAFFLKKFGDSMGTESPRNIRA